MMDFSKIKFNKLTSEGEITSFNEVLDYIYGERWSRDRPELDGCSSMNMEMMRDDLNQDATCTINRLVSEGRLSKEKAKEYLECFCDLNLFNRGAQKAIEQKKSVKQEVIDLLLAIQKAEDSVEAAKLKKALSDTLVKVLEDNISFKPTDLMGCDIGPDGEKILGEVLIGFLDRLLSCKKRQ